MRPQVILFNDNSQAFWSGQKRGKPLAAHCPRAPLQHTFPGFLAAGGKVLRGDPCDPGTLISETKCLYPSPCYSRINSPRATVPTGAICASGQKKALPSRRDQSYPRVSKHPGGSEEHQFAEQTAAALKGRATCLHSLPPPLHRWSRSSLMSTPYTPLKVEFTTRTESLKWWAEKSSLLL